MINQEKNVLTFICFRNYTNSGLNIFNDTNNYINTGAIPRIWKSFVMQLALIADVIALPFLCGQMLLLSIKETIKNHGIGTLILSLPIMIPCLICFTTLVFTGQAIFFPIYCIWSACKEEPGE